MKVLLTSLAIIVFLSVSLYAEDVFTDRNLKGLQVKGISVEEGKAWIENADGTKTEVTIGDVIGVEKAVVTEITEVSITVQTDNTRTRMPLVYGFE